jgi:hypothetical protein
VTDPPGPSSRQAQPNTELLVVLDALTKGTAIKRRLDKPVPVP